VHLRFDLADVMRSGPLQLQTGDGVTALGSGGDQREGGVLTEVLGSADGASVHDATIHASYGGETADQWDAGLKPDCTTCKCPSRRQGAGSLGCECEWTGLSPREITRVVDEGRVLQLIIRQSWPETRRFGADSEIVAEIDLPDELCLGAGALLELQFAVNDTLLGVSCATPGGADRSANDSCHFAAVLSVAPSRESATHVCRQVLVLYCRSTRQTGKMPVDAGDAHHARDAVSDASCTGTVTTSIRTIGMLLTDAHGVRRSGQRQ